MIELTLLSLLWFVIGYVAGHLNGTKKDIKEFVDETGKVIQIEAKKLVAPKIPTGQIKSPTAQEIYKRKLNPERREALDEVKKTLDNIPELVQAKELAEAMRKDQYAR